MNTNAIEICELIKNLSDLQTRPARPYRATRRDLRPRRFEHKTTTIDLIFGIRHDTKITDAQQRSLPRSNHAK
jgi:hypothetical protein